MTQEWPYTFPILTPTTDYQPVILADNLYYLNTIESAASAMEASVISGRNAAQLILGHSGFKNSYTQDKTNNVNK